MRRNTRRSMRQDGADADDAKEPAMDNLGLDIDHHTEPEQKRLSLVARLRSALPMLALEVGSIMLSILLALWVSEWQEDINNKKLALKALGNFKEEILLNQSVIEATLPLYKGYATKLGALQGPVTSLTDVTRAMEFKSLGAGTGYTTAWETAVATNALVEIDYDTVKRLSRVYLGQQYNELLRQKFLDLFYNPQTFRNENAATLVIILDLMLSDLIRVQESLSKDYKDILHKIDERYPELRGLTAAAPPRPVADPGAAPTLPPEAER